jgi:hypothetical protein
VGWQRPPRGRARHPIQLAVGRQAREIRARLPLVAVRRQAVSARRVERHQDHVRAAGRRRDAGHHRIEHRPGVERLAEHERQHRQHDHFTRQPYAAAMRRADGRIDRGHGGNPRHASGSHHAQRTGMPALDPDSPIIRPSAQHHDPDEIRQRKWAAE